MQNIDTKNYQQQLNKIWNREDFHSDPLINQYIQRGYAFPETHKADVLFVGLNPAGREEQGESFSYDIQQAVKDLPNFYGRYNLLAQKIGTSWTYTDLFYFKETDSNVVDQMLKNPLAVQFLVEQLRVTQTLMEEITPKVIVVFNAKARKFFGLEQNREKNEGIWMGYTANNEELYRKFGTPVITQVQSDILRSINHTKQTPIPIFFDGFISYQPAAAIDRLAWHIQYALNLL